MAKPVEQFCSYCSRECGGRGQGQTVKGKRICLACIATRCISCGREFTDGERRSTIKSGSFCIPCLSPYQSPAASSPDADAAEIRHAKILQACGEGNVLAKIVYRKPGEEWVTERFVEPYQFTHSSTALMVMCWQATPEIDEPSWRTFRVDRIVKADPTTQAFRPRQPVTLHTGESTRFKFGEMANEGKAKSPPSPQQIYTERLHLALRELDLKEKDRIILARIAKELQPEQVRAVHGRFYAETLSEVCADGRVTADEIDKLTAVRVWLTELGWGP